jgi:hypothetical protein
MIEAQTQFRGRLYRAALLDNVSIHFLFDYDPNRPDEKIKIRLSFQNSKGKQTYLDKFRKLVNFSGISEYFDFKEIAAVNSSTPVYTNMCFVGKKERKL